MGGSKPRTNHANTLPNRRRSKPKHTTTNHRPSNPTNNQPNRGTNTMTEISNKTLALLILATLAVVVTATSVQLGGFTGLVTDEGEGTVTLSIDRNLEILVDGDINFGSCTPNSTSAYVLDSSDGTIRDIYCSGGGALPAAINVENIGNVDVGINVTSECSTHDWLPTVADTNQFNLTPSGTCAGALTTADVTLASTSPSLCTNLTPATNFDVNAQILIDSTTGQGGLCGVDSINTLTFIGFEP